MIKVAINGFGRIGRTSTRVYFDKHKDQMKLVGINDLVDAETLAHLLKYDSNYGVWGRNVSGKKSLDDPKKAEPGKQVGKISVDGVDIPTFATKEPSSLPWKELEVDVVIESTGIFTNEEGMQGHLDAGAGKVVLSAPAKGGNVGTFLLGVNEEKYKGEKLINNASCTTNCIAPVASIIHNKFGVKKGLVTTVHGYTADQDLQDGPHRDLRRARSAAVNIIPTTTGAAIATTEAIPELKGLFDGRALRVPVPVGSISDFTFLLGKKTSVEEINSVLEAASKEKRFEGILAVTKDPVVSSDIVGRSESSIVDLSLTQVVDGDMVKVFAWYDNEFGYSNRLIEQVIQVGNS